MNRNTVFERSSTSCVHMNERRQIKLNICAKGTTLIQISNVAHVLHKIISSKV